MKKIVWPIVALLVCLVGMYFSPPRVQTEEVTLQALPLTLTVDASVAALHMQVVVPQVSGPIVSVPLPKVGQVVHKGDVLAKIDGKGIEQALKSVPSSSATVAAPSAERLAQLQSWYAMGAISKAEYDRLVQQASKVSPAVPVADMGRSQAAAFALQQLSLVADMDGIITSVSTNPSVAMAGVPYATIQQERPLVASFAVPEAVLAGLQQSWKKREIRAWVTDGKGTEEEGEVTWISSSADATTHSALGKVTITNGSNAFKAGEFYKVRLETKEQVERITVPKEAVRTSAGGDYVYLVSSDGLVSIRTVLIGGEENGRYYIIGGLHPGDRIITAPGSSIQAGMKVRLSY